jgi:Ca-activated chloride channel family protein
MINSELFIEQFHFLRPYWLLLLLPLSALIYWRWRREEQATVWKKRLPEHLRQALLVNEATWRNNLPLKGLIVVAVIATVIAAGPSWYRQASPFAEEAAPLVVVLDVSSSMRQTDVAPSRLFIAKQKVLQLLELRNRGKVSLVVFAGSAHLAMPPTMDLAVLEPLLNAIKPEMMPREGKFAEYALSPIESALATASSSGSVLLVTDGLSDAAMEAFQRYFSTYEHQLLIWGVGQTQSKAKFPLEEQRLSSLAREVSGKWIPFTVDHSDVDVLASSIAQHAKFTGAENEPWFDSGYVLLAPLMLLYLLWFRRGWIVQWIIVIVLVGGAGYSPNTYAKSMSWADIWLTKDQQGQRLFNQQQYDKAAKVFQEPYWKATAYYFAGDYQSAQQYYLRVDTVEAQLGAAAALAHQREYMAARRLYREILDNVPGNKTASHNLELMEAIIKHINEFSEGQQSSGEMESSQELGEQPETADGVTQELDPSLLKEEKLSAEELLASAEAHKKWMKRVGSDLSVFLALKFQRQLELGLATQKPVIRGQEAN